MPMCWRSCYMDSVFVVKSAFKLSLMYIWVWTNITDHPLDWPGLRDQHAVISTQTLTQAKAPLLFVYDF